MRRDLDAVVWVADDQVAPGLDYGVRLVERLEARGLRVEQRDLTNAGDGAPTAELHVLSGGGTPVGDQSGWMPRALHLTGALIEAANKGDHAVLGVCLGSQMIAETLWPGSVRGTGRIEVGLTNVVWRPAGATAGENLVVPAFHYEEIDRAHAVNGGANVIAENRRAGLQGFRFGERAWGLQFHPELDPADVRRLVMHHRQTIEMYHGSAAAALASVDELEAAWSPEVFDKILDQLDTA